MRATPSERAGDALRLAGGLGLTPGAVGISLLFLPRMRVGPLPANIIAFAGATLVPILALAILANAEVRSKTTLVVAAISIATLTALAFLHPPPLAALLLVDSALVAGAWAIGTTIGRRVQHPAHLLPACVVAASADLVSLLSPEGPTHAIVESERALSVLAVWFPVPGTGAVAPALGVGDLLFIGLVFGVAAVHRLPYARTVGLAALGTSLAGLGAAWLAVAVPALLPIAAALLLGLPEIRALRPADRMAAKWAMIIACSVALAVVARTLFSGDPPR